MEPNEICCFTGHRSIDPRDANSLPSALDKVLCALYRRGVRTFRAGGALGFDTFAALRVLEMKEVYPDVRLELCLPCRDQANKWSARDRKIYDHILKRSDSVRYVTDHYYGGCMQARNRMLVDGAGYCVAYYSGSPGGTRYTCTYALGNGLKLVNTYEMIRK